MFRSQYILLFLSLFFSINVSVFAGILKVEGTVYEVPDKIVGCNIVVHKNGVPAAYSKSDNQGLFSLNLELGASYMLEFSRKGYVSKKININTSDAPKEESYNMKNIAVDLFREQTAKDFSILNRPIAKIIYNVQQNAFVYDMTYNAKIQDKVQELWFEVRSFREQRDKAYKKAWMKAELHFKMQDYQTARPYYILCLEQREMALKPKERIAFIDGLGNKQVSEIPEIEVTEQSVSRQEEVITRGNKIITKRHIQKGDKTIGYHSVEHKNGQKYYFRRNIPISYNTWLQQTTEN